MAKFPIKSFLLFCSRRSYTAAASAAETAVVQPAASGVRTAMDSTTSTTNSKTEAAGVQQKESFWMKDPKTGNWIPETHFDDTDVVALREKFLPGRHPF